jgi:cytochrome c
MSKFPDAIVAALIALGATAGPTAAWADGFGLGRAATGAEIAAWDIDVRPDGLGLPEGQGSVADGEVLFTDRCASCHGDFGEGVGRWPVLAGGQGTLTRERPVKTIGSYWPYLSTVFDYVHRAMPFGDAQSLSADETYAVTAYLLYLNDVVTEEEFVLSRENFAEVRLPNEARFVDDPRPDTATPTDGAPCMTDCRDAVAITMRAAVLDVTPESENLSGAVVSDDGSMETAPAAEPEPAEIAAATAPDPALVDAGEKVFRKCRACHQVGPDAKNRVGPHLNGVIGRAAGALEGFAYSSAMAEKGAAGTIWTPDALDAFLADPKAFVPGTKMAFAGLNSAEDRAAVVAYLSGFPE